jgi:nucleotide-binding universal stress UspA family protein
MYGKMVVGIDGSPGGYVAVSHATNLARSIGGSLFAISAAEAPPRFAATIAEVDDFMAEREQYFEHVRREANLIASRHGFDLKHVVRIGSAAQVIVQYVDVSADLVVLGCNECSWLRHWIRGRTARRVSARSSACVLIVKARPPAPLRLIKRVTSNRSSV